MCITNILRKHFGFIRILTSLLFLNSEMKIKLLLKKYNKWNRQYKN